MKKAKKLSNKLLAALLSMAMILTTVLPSTTVYAAEPAIEAETAGSEDTASDNEVPDGIGTENGTTDETGSGEGSGETTPGDEETLPGDEETLPGDGETNEPGSGDEGSGETTPGDGENEEPGLGEDGSDENDADAEGSDENTDGEEAELEGMIEDYVLDADEVLSDVTVAQSALTAGGWNESIYAEIADPNVEPTDVMKVSWSDGNDVSSYTRNDTIKHLDYLVRKIGNVIRIDIPGVKAGTYTLTIEVGQSTLTQSGIQVYAYDRAGYAHYNYTDGVGAYKDDGTLKDNAIVIYVNNGNKNDVTVKSKDGTEVKGIGNILNSVGEEYNNTGKTKPNDKGNCGTPNDNKGIIRKLAADNTPLVVRFIGTVSESGLGVMGTFDAKSAGEIEGLTEYASYDYGGSADDNGHMARMKSGKNITLEGIGYDATIDGWGFHFMAESSTSALNQEYGTSFEVRNLTFINTPEDAIGMEGVQKNDNIQSELSASVERCWIHNNEFYSPKISNPAESDKSEGDGSVDFKRGQYFTCSYNYFEGCHKTNLVGSSGTSLQFNLSYHHNYWFMCKARGPMARNANIHMYNNLVDMQVDYAQNPRCGAYIFSEYNMFYMAKRPQDVDSKETKNNQVSAIKSYNDNLASPLWDKAVPGTVVTDINTYVPNDCKFIAKNIDYSTFETKSEQSYIPDGANGNAAYKASLKTDFTELRKVIASQTGVLDRSPVLAKDVTPNQYSVVDRNVKQNKQTVEYIDLSNGQSYENNNIKKSKVPFAFEVGAEVDVTIAYDGEKGTLVNEAGEMLLDDDGTAQKLPAGKYMIQANNLQPGSYANGTATLATFKEIKISSLKIDLYDASAHYHKWVLNDSKSQKATCTEGGFNYYECEGTGECDLDGNKTEAVKATGHSFGSWETISEQPDENNKVVQQRKCKNCDVIQEQTVDAGSIGSGSTGGSGSGGGIIGGGTVEGDYILYFTNDSTGAKVDPSNFFTISGGSVQKNKGLATINGEEYKAAFKIGGSSNGKVTFRCNEGASIYLAFWADNASKVVTLSGKETGDVKTQTIAKDGAENTTATVEGLLADEYTISGAKEINLIYAAVTNTASNIEYATLTLHYNYDEAPGEKEVQVPVGTIISSEQELATEASFSRRDHTLKGFYEDSSCTRKISFPYTVTGDATLFADWEEKANEEVSYIITFNTNGGSTISPVRISASAVHVLTETPTRTGYAFAGWYDANPNIANSGAKRIDKIIGSELTGHVTVYAKWNPIVEDNANLTLNCATDLAGKGTTPNDKGEFNIIQKTDVKGYTLYALDGGDGGLNTSGEYNRKFYMSVKKKDDKLLLYTNGVLLTKEAADIAGNENGLLKSIEFTTDGPGTLAVEVQPSGSVVKEGQVVATCNITLGQKSGTSLEAISEESISDKVTKEFEIEEAGTYYLYATGTMGVAYTSIKFLEPVYTIVYQTGMGTAELPNAQTKKIGDVITVPKCDPMSGYIFKGWSVNGTMLAKDGDNSTYTVKASDAVNGTITLTAVYDVDPDYKPGGSGGGDEGDPDPDTESGLAIVGLEETYAYTGAKIIPNIGVIDYNIGTNGTLLAPGIDYTVKYSNNVKSSTDPKNKDKKATVIVTGKGNYAGKAPKPAYFTIVENKEITEGLADLKGAKIDKINPVDYNGNPHYPDFKITFKNKSTATYTHNGTAYEIKAKEGEDAAPALNVNIAVSNNINKGTATILVTGSGTTKVKKTFKINALDISSKATITSTPGKYAVKGATPESLDVKVTIEGSEVTLRKGIDYTVKYSANKKVGKGKVVITGKGNYTKKKDAQFDVEKLDLSDCNITGVVAYADLKTSKIKATVLDGQKNALKASQYTLKVYKNADCTEAYTDTKLKAATSDDDVIYVQAEAKDTNNLILKTAPISVKVGKNISKAKIAIVKVGKKTKTFDYTGSSITLDASDLTVTIKEGKTTKTLYMDEVEGEGGHKASYEIVGYMNNINKGTATAIIQGTGEYSGTKTVKFKIVGKAMNIDNDKNTPWESITNGFKNFMNGLFN